MDIAQILPRTRVASGRPSYEWTENDQTYPAGMYRAIVTGDAWVLQRALAVDWTSTRDVFTVANDGAISIIGNVTIAAGASFTCDNVTARISQGITGLTVSDSPTFAAVNTPHILADLTVHDNLTVVGSLSCASIVTSLTINGSLTITGSLTIPYMFVTGTADYPIDLSGATANEADILLTNNGKIKNTGAKIDFITHPTYYLRFAEQADVPTLYGVGAYLRVGDNSVTSHSLASEDDLMVSGKLEVDGATYFDSTVTLGSTLAIGGDIDMNSHKITELADPSATTDAANARAALAFALCS